MPTYTEPASVGTVGSLGGSVGTWTPHLEIFPTPSYFSWGPQATGSYGPYLEFSAFGFSVPSTEIIVGVTVDYFCGTLAPLSGAHDHSVVLFDSLSLPLPGCVDHATGGLWSLLPAPPTKQERGSPSDVWGCALTPAIVNRTDYGFAVSCAWDSIVSSGGGVINQWPSMTITTMLPSAIAGAIGNLGGGLHRIPKVVPSGS